MSRKKKSRKMGLVAPRSLPKEERRQLRKSSHKKVTKGKGLPAGSRFNPAYLKGNKTEKKAPESLDPRHGSKKPVPLITQPVKTDLTLSKQSKEAYSEITSSELALLDEAAQLEQELEALENNVKLQYLLDCVEQGEALASEDEAWVDAQLERYAELVQALGFDLDTFGEDDAEDEAANWQESDGEKS